MKGRGHNDQCSEYCNGEHPDLLNPDGYPIVVPAGTDYAAAIAQLLFFAFPHADYGIDFPDTGITTPKLCYPEDADWLAEAHQLAEASLKALIHTPDRRHRDGMWRLVSVKSRLARDEERRLALTLAFQLGFLNPDDMLDSMSASQWAEWKRWLAARERKS